MSKLRTRLVLMSLIGLVPALAAILYTQSSERDAARFRTLENNLRITRLAAPPASLSGGDRPWFRLVLETKTTAIGEYQISRLTGEPNINIAHPLLDRDGNVKRVLVAAVELRTLGALIDRVEMPAGATLAVFDRNRTILARHPDAARWVGQQEPSSALRQATDINPVDMIEETGVDGVRRFYVGAPVEGDVPTGLYVGMG